MRYLVDHDYHIHTKLSFCSGDEAQSCRRIEEYALESGLSSVCITDHFWDEKVPLEAESAFYAGQNFAHISQSFDYEPANPRRVRFYFGCETEMNQNFTLGITPERIAALDFVIVPTTHFHMTGFTVPDRELSAEELATLYVERLWALLSMPLPFEKIGIAHLTCPLIAPNGEYIDVLNRIPDKTFAALFAEVAAKGAGVELNFRYDATAGDDLAAVLRPYRIAAKQKCRFYFGSDAHHPAVLDAAKSNFERIVDALDLKEEQKFHPAFYR